MSGTTTAQKLGWHGEAQQPSLHGEAQQLGWHGEAQQPSLHGEAQQLGLHGEAQQSGWHGEITVGVPTGRSFRVPCSSEDTVDWLKAQMVGRTGVPVGNQRLVFQSRILQHNLCTLGSHKIEPGCMVRCSVY